MWRSGRAVAPYGVDGCVAARPAVFGPRKEELLVQMLRSEAGRRSQGMALYIFDARFAAPRERLAMALTVLSGILMRSGDDVRWRA